LTCYSPQDTWTQNGTNHENLPINCVTWYEAYAFCIWDGGFLPAEAEWEYAAAGGSEQREYPWGSAGPGTANQYAIYGYNYGTLGAYMAPVGYASLGAGRWGQLDLVGEVLEWNVDSYATTYVDPCTDCAYLTAPSSQVARGGLYIGSAVFLSPSFTYFGPSPTLRDFIGFRCARTP
jgi:formylglycine-generating enzyme required for sulfatase activity